MLEQDVHVHICTITDGSTLSCTIIVWDFFEWWNVYRVWMQHWAEHCLLNLVITAPLCPAHYHWVRPAGGECPCLIWRVFVFRWFTRCRCPQCPGSHFPHFNVKTILSPLPELGSLSWASQPHSDQHPQPHAGMPSSPLMRTLVDFLKLWFLNDKNCVVHFKKIKSTMNFFLTCLC